MRKMALIPVILAAILVAWLGCAYYENNYMRQKLPPIFEVYRYEVDDILRSYANACLVRGTGSMAPAIRGGAPNETVAVVIYDRGRDYSLLGAGDLVLFERGSETIVHQLAQLDKGGWITSGSANSRYDSGRVTRESFRGIVTKIYNIKP